MAAKVNEQMEPDQENSPTEVTFWEFWTQIPIKLQRESILFLIVNVCDIVMTWYLLAAQAVLNEGRSTTFYESNPVAKYIIDHWGIAGMIYFKFGMVALVILITQIIAHKKLATARFVLNFGSGVVVCVVFYSLWLLVSNTNSVAM